MKKGIFALILYIAIAGCSKSPEVQLAEALQRAQQHLESFDFENAQKDFDQAAEFSGPIPYSQYGKALILEQQLYDYDALNFYLKAIEFNPDFSLPYARIYEIYSKLDFPDRAGAAASRYYALEPDNPASALVMARFNESVGQYYNAAKILELAETSETDKTLSLLQKSKSEYHLHNFSEGDSLLAEAFVHELTTPAQYFAAAEAFEIIGNIDSAMALNSKAVLLPQVTVSDLYRYFDRALKSNYYFEARQAIRMLAEKGAARGIQLTLKMLMEMDKGNFVNSVMRYSELLDYTPRNVSIMMYDLFSGGKQHTDSRLPSIVRSIVNAYMNEFDYDIEVREYVGAKITLQKGFTEDRVGAWRELRNIKEPFARLKNVQLQQAYLRYRIGQFDEALEDLQKLQSLHIHHTDWLIEIADIYAHSQVRKYKLAEQAYDMALKNDKWSRSALIKKVNMLLSLDRIEEAKKAIDEFPHLLEHYADVNLLNGLVLAKNGQFNDAFDLFEKYGQQLKGDLNYFTRLLFILEDSYEFDRVRELALLGSKLSGANPDMLTFSSRLLCDSKEFENAEKVIEKALAIEPRLTKARVQKARTLYAKGERQQAFDIFDAVLDEDPMFGDVNYYFSQILSLEKIDAPRAANLARSAVRVFYDDIKARVNVSEVYFRFGQYAPAYGEANKASLDHPNSPLVWYEKGRAAVQLGRKEAGPSLQKAIDLGLGGEKLIKANELLANL